MHSSSFRCNAAISAFPFPLRFEIQFVSAEKMYSARRTRIMTEGNIIILLKGIKMKGKKDSHYFCGRLSLLTMQWI